jgi:anti-sigma factor RsiW
VTCSPERVTGYVDRALDPEATAEVLAHIAACPQCREQAEFEQSLRGRLRAIAQEEPTQELVRRVLQGAKKRRPSVLRFSLPAAASLAALLIVGARASAPLLSAELVADHVGCFARTGEEKVFVSGPEPGPVAQWLAENGSPIPPPPRAPGGLALLGARRCMLVPETAVVAHLLYQMGERQSSIFVLRGIRPIREDYLTEQGGHTVRLMRVGSHTVGIVSDHPSDGEAIRQALLLSNAWNEVPGSPLLTAQASLATILVRPGGL